MRFRPQAGKPEEEEEEEEGAFSKQSYDCYEKVYAVLLVLNTAVGLQMTIIFISD